MREVWLWRKLELFSLGVIGITSVTLAFIYFFVTYRGFVEEPMPVKPVHQEVAQVLGAASQQQACSTSDEFMGRLISVHPNISITAGTERKIIKTSSLAQCFTVNERKINETSCPIQILDVAETCIEDEIKKQVQFFQGDEVIRSEKGYEVSARVSDSVIDTKGLAEKVRLALLQPFTYHDPIENLKVIAPTRNDLPNTSGNIEIKYIEIDTSRQLLFLWNKGSYRTFRISGAIPEYDPIGVYRIINKSKLAWSNTANKWMPYWMAFTWDKKQRAMLGIHALVYWYPGLGKTGGKKIFEPETNIGTPKSTGCLRLTVNDARKVFEATDVGDLLVVHQ